MTQTSESRLSAVLSHPVVSDCVTPWTVACQAPLSMGFSRQEYWSGLLCPPPEDVPDPEIEHASVMSLVLTGGFNSTTWKASLLLYAYNFS